jgi:hypothetical protein
MLRRSFARLKSKLLPEKLLPDMAVSALDGAGTIADVVLHPDNVKHQPWLAGVKARGASVDLLPIAHPSKDAQGRISSFAYEPPRPEYDRIVVSRHIHLFEHSWSYAFLDRLNGLLAKDGRIVVPRCRRPEHQISDARLAQLFGSAPRPAGRNYQTFAKAPGGLARPPEASYSILDAYWPLMRNLIDNEFDPRLKEVIHALGVAQPGSRTGMTLDLMTSLQSQSYRTNSASTKSAIMQYIMAQCLPGRGGLHLIDVGAGTGLNSFEILLNPAGVSSLTLVEINRGNYWPIALMYEALGERIRGKVRLVDKPGQDFSAHPADAAMVCGVYSMLPREARDDFTANVWANVAPGGIFAVLENMRSGDGSRYDEVRATPPELDASMARFGPIRYFLADAMQELRPEEVGNLSVFRVLQKPA